MPPFLFPTFSLFHIRLPVFKPLLLGPLHALVANFNNAIHKSQVSPHAYFLKSTYDNLSKARVPFKFGLIYDTGYHLQTTHNYIIAHQSYMVYMYVAFQ